MAAGYECQVAGTHFFHEFVIGKRGIAEAQRQLGSGLVEGRCPHRMISHMQHLTGKYKELTAWRRQRYSGLTADEEVGSQAIFHLFDLGTEGGLCELDAFRCSAETALFRYGHERYKMAKLGSFIHDCHDLSTLGPTIWQSEVALDMVRLLHC